MLLFFVFKPMVLADDMSVSWVNGANTASLNSQFDVRIKVVAPTAGTYYLGVGNDPCSIEILNTSNNSWSNGCYVGISAMQSIIINSDGGSNEETLRLREISSSGSKTFYGYVYDSNRKLLATSSLYSVTVNGITPTSTPTLTPTPSPTSTPTLTPTITPTKVLTPTPTEIPVIEPTVASEITITPTMVEEKTSENKSSSSFLPIIFIVFGLLMLAVPFLGPKIVAKIKFKKQRKPPMIPPFTGLNDQSL